MTNREQKYLPKLTEAIEERDKFLHITIPSSRRRIVTAIKKNRTDKAKLSYAEDYILRIILKINKRAVKLFYKAYQRRESWPRTVN